jgi:SpoVK/Ycf46/Vps4 family AAA+-type ATPase
MVLTSSDIGTDPSQVEINLTTQFKRAKSWGAVLLIDEADIFMQERDSRDLERNGLVAGFLRALEFFDGILFLTTNRVGVFDDAFMSRVHVKLYYANFNDEQRAQIWQTFVDKLARERSKDMRLNMDAKEYLKSKAVKAMKWNGREIRNGKHLRLHVRETRASH